MEGATAPPGVEPPALVTPPRLLSEPLVEYPATGSGAAVVVLELVIGAAGDVTVASVFEGSEPFASAALDAAQGWRFEPARSGDVAVAAKIRFQVRFAEPEPSAIPALPAPSAPDPALAPSAPIEVTVLGERPEARARTLTRAEVRQLPGAFGDPFRAIEALPGVTPLVSGVPFFYVRGAPPGNVGYFLDGIRLPLLYHVGLGPSVVHPGMVERVDLYPGAYPTRYGRFSGGIVAGEATAPSDDWRGEWQLRLFDAGAMTEAPFLGGKGHVLVGGRYSYTAYLISLIGQDVRLEYWDYQLRASYELGERDTLSAFVFGSFDYFGEDTSASDDELFSTEFHRIDLRHRHELSERSELRTALTLGLDRTRLGEDVGATINHRVQLRSEYTWRIDPDLKLSAGIDGVIDAYRVDAIFENDEGVELNPGSTTDSDEDDEAEFRRLFPTRRDVVTGAYAELTMDVAPHVRLVPGLRSDVYASDGALAVSIEPRLSAEFEVSQRLTLKNAVGLAAQPPSFVVPIAGFEIGGLPGGLQRGVQSSAGFEYRLPDDMSLGVSVFHNAFFNMTDILSLVRVDALTDDDNDSLLPDTRTRGQAYGLELMFHRDLTRKLGGFLSYTLSRSLRSTQFGRIVSSFDRTHVLNVALAYDLGRRWRAGGRFVFYTGAPNDPLASGRLPAFHRLDLRLEKRWPIGGKGAFAAFVIEVQNSTLSTEVVSNDCDLSGCTEQEIGPITIPSLAFEGRF